MNIESMRIRSYRSFKVDEHLPAVAAERYRTLKAYDRLRAAGCHEVDPSAPCPEPVLDGKGRQGRDGPASEVPLHGQGAHLGPAGAQGACAERVHGRPHPRARPGGRRDPPGVLLRGAHQAQAPPPLREVGPALEVRRQGAPPLSLPLSTLEPIGGVTCITLSLSASGTSISSGASAKVESTVNSVPNKDR